MCVISTRVRYIRLMATRQVISVKLYEKYFIMQERCKYYADSYGIFVYIISDILYI